VANGRRSPRLGLWPLLGFIALTGLGQAIPLYTDWLWYSEVGFTQVFTRVLSLRGWLFLGAGGAVFLFMYGNLWVAARTAAPDVLWELDDQLRLPGRAVLEPLIRRLLLPVIAVIAVLSVCGRARRGSWCWATSTPRPSAPRTLSSAKTSPSSSSSCRSGASSTAGDDPCHRQLLL
jgi:hypothetical protein